jgi:hypothetical protein
VAVAKKICRLLAERGIAPATLIEPTCGVGNFLLVALDQFPSVSQAWGIEINSDHADKLLTALQGRTDHGKVTVLRESFFHAPLATLLQNAPEPLLALGNPPWVTNAHLGVLASDNLPKKTNFQNHNGLAALTGKSNFDISEWMLIRLLELLQGRHAVMAMLCKTAVARKVLLHAWKHRFSLESAEIRTIDAAALFGAAVDACLFLCFLSPAPARRGCHVFRRLEDTTPAQTLGYQDNLLLADVAAYQRWHHLRGKNGPPWRSGIKHDCAKVMELCKEGGRYRNGFDKLVELEDDYLYPMLKSSELANGRTQAGRRWMLVTQRSVGDDTALIRSQAPKTWQYLQENSDALDRRASSIYRKRPRFAVFGVGDYSFSPWKVAISGFYKKLHFTVIGPVDGKPVVLDDTCYFLACQTEAEAVFVAALLNSTPAREFFAAFIFWDAKRPITVEVLRQLDLVPLARELSREEGLKDLRGLGSCKQANDQSTLFELM